jgi:hypothetical protein
MKTIFAASVIAAGIMLAPATAGAGERVGDAAMGALAGAVVLGPVGAVAGGVIGYTAGPGIGRGLRGHKTRSYRQVRRTRTARPNND